MTFSYLRAYANTKRSGLLGSYIVSAIINGTLLGCLLVTPTSFFLNLQLIILTVEVILSFVLFICALYPEELIQKSVAKRDFSQLIRFTQIYNFLEKYRWFDFAYSLITFVLFVCNMVTVGWIWQTVLFIFFYGLSAIKTRTFVYDLPQFVSTLDIKEEDLL
jgi:hypothetical protein